ncbi:MAG: cytochrome c [Bacteroidota bacterium]
MKQLIIPAILGITLMAFQTTPAKKTPVKPAVTKPAVAATNPLKASMERGKTVYQLRCLACHQPDGGGVPHLNAPLDGTSTVKGNDKAKLIRIVLKGMKGVEVDGEDYSNVMAPHADLLTDQQIADVLTYVRNNWTNKASAVTAAEVKAVRAKNK